MNLNPFKVPENVRIYHEYATDDEHFFSKKHGHSVYGHPATRIVAVGTNGNSRVVDRVVPDVRTGFLPDRLKPILTELRRKRVATKLGRSILKV